MHNSTDAKGHLVHICETPAALATQHYFRSSHVYMLHLFMFFLCRALDCCEVKKENVNLHIHPCRPFSSLSSASVFVETFAFKLSVPKRLCCGFDSVDCACIHAFPQMHALRGIQ